ncbi:MAG: hypothetical protein ABI557_20110, partial [Aureliella sp.]
MPTKYSMCAALYLKLGLILFCGWSATANAQESDRAGAAPESPPSPSSKDTPQTETKISAPPLASDQKSVAERFSRLEILLLRSADLEAGENPTRAALLQQAVQLSK